MHVQRKCTHNHRSFVMPKEASAKQLILSLARNETNVFPLQYIPKLDAHPPPPSQDLGISVERSDGSGAHQNVDQPLPDRDNKLVMVETRRDFSS